MTALGPQDQRAQRATVEHERQDEKARVRGPAQTLAENDLVARVVLAAIGQGAAILHDQRDEARVVREPNANEDIDFLVDARCGDDFVRSRRFVEDRHRGEIELAISLAALTPASTTSCSLNAEPSACAAR